VRNAARTAAGGENPLVLIPEGKLSAFSTVAATRLVLLRWEGGEFVESAGTPATGSFLTGADFLSPDGLGRGGKIVASVIDQSGSILKAKFSRLVLFQVE
jgi:hypothetical protein